MTRCPQNVTLTHVPSDRLPDWSGEGVTLLLDLQRRGLLAQVEEQFRIARQGGFAGFDVFLFLLYFFGSRMKGGLRNFWVSASVHGEALAAVGGRVRLPSPAAISRALGIVDPELPRSLSGRLLMEVPGIDDVLRHPSAQTFDATGSNWHLFDFDPTVTTLRQRRLASGADLPPGHRRSADLAAPGHAGRKRGEVQFRRAALQHAGSALWLAGGLERGNGDRRAELTDALDALVATCARIHHPLSRSLIRMDGEFGSVPAYTACRERGVPFLTRLNRPEMYLAPDVRRRLAEATWTYVASDCSGPRRAAAELGTATIPAAPQTRRSDGTPFAPVTVRVIVSRYRRDGEAEHGHIIHGWQYELFVADVGVEPWPAADLVRAYFGRGGQENRFAQEDRELGLDHVFSYHLPGQALAVLVGLMVWNLRIVRGFELDSPPAVAATGTPRRDEIDPRPAGHMPEEPDEEPDEPPPAPSEAEAELGRRLTAWDWTRWNKKNPGWCWEPETVRLLCPTGKPHGLITVSVPERGRRVGQALFRGARGACATCPLRSECHRAATPIESPRSVGITVDRDFAQRLRRLHRVASAARNPRRVPKPRPRRRTLGIAVPATEIAPGDFAVRDATLLPAVSRRFFADAIRGLSVSVSLQPTAPRERLHPMLAASPAARHHRRLTWQQHLARYAREPGSPVCIALNGGLRLQSIIDPKGALQ